MIKRNIPHFWDNRVDYCLICGKTWNECQLERQPHVCYELEMEADDSHA